MAISFLAIALISLVIGTFIAAANFPPRVLDRLRLRRFRRSKQADSPERRRNTALAESVQDVIVELDDQGTILFVSDNMERIADRPVRELIGQSIRTFTGFQATSSLERSLMESGRITEQSVASTPRPRNTQFIMADGSERWFESIGSTYRTLDDELRVLIRTRDITERIEQESKTAENEVRLRRAERIANLGSWEFYPVEERLIWSDQMYRLHGLIPESSTIDLDQVRSLIDPNDFKSLMSSMLSPDPSNEARYRIRRADDGTTRNLFTRGEIDRDPDGKIVRVSGTSMDVTDQLELEDKLRRGQQHYQALVDSNMIGMFFSSRYGFITDANSAFLSLLGYTKEDLPIDWTMVTPADRLSNDIAIHQQLQETGIALPYEREFIGKDGDRVLMLVAYARIDPEYVMAIAVDLSERSRAEAFIQQYQKELEATIADRTLELVKSRDKLIQNDRLAAVGTLAAGVAHQINNPIGAILNSAEFALLCREDEDSSVAFEKALRVNLAEARRCAQIVKGMLLFSRDESAPRWPEDLGDVVRRAHRAIGPYAADHSCQVEIRIEEKATHSLISPIEIEQAIVNVLRNAIESGATNVAVSLSLVTEDDSAEIEVLDDGRGIPSEQKDHLFEPFYSTRTNEGGTGLGLSVAHGILTGHGGQIQIDSILGEGTRVLMMLPITKSPVEDSPN